MKVRAIREYYDKQLNRLVKSGEKIEVADDRAKVLINANVGVIDFDATTPEVATKPAPKKATTRKKVNK